MEKILSMVTPDDVETQVLSWGSFQWLNEPRVTGATNMMVGVGRIKPGDGHGRHNHPGSNEFIYFLEGQAEQMVEGPEGAETKMLKAGDLVYIPDGTYHSTKNVGDGELVFIACYQNEGPEKLIRADAEIIPAVNAG